MLGLLWVDSESAFELPKDVAVRENDLGSNFWAKDAKEYWLP
jgi:hypothetical protein